MAVGLGAWREVWGSASDGVHRLPTEVLTATAAAVAVAVVEVRDVLIAWLNPDTLPLHLFAPALVEAVQVLPVP